MTPVRPTAAIMIQGTGSNVGKSLLVAGLARAYTRAGLTVRPFKPQNMSNNAAACPGGGEIGRAQALQARACGVAPSVHMNPVLLKPESETGAQVIVQGRRTATVKAGDYGRHKASLMPAVLDSFGQICAGADLVIVEGAGSPAEVNLRAGDIANMGFACAADVPVILAGDIDRGGVIASLVGCHAVLDACEVARIKGFLINKFRGDRRLFDDGLAMIAARTGWPALGVVPYFAAASDLPAEDSVDLEQAMARRASPEPRTAILRIVVPRLPRIANFDDLDPLRLEPGIAVEMIGPGRPLPRDADVIVLPGSKSTVADLAALRAEGWDIDIAAHVRQGGRVLGICGGYQMLGRVISDPGGLEGAAGDTPGLGLLDVTTVLTPDKAVTPRAGRDTLSGHAVEGYEIHLGRSEGPDTARPFVVLDGAPDGACSADGRVMGTYLHGLFAADPFRRHMLAALGMQASALSGSQPDGLAGLAYNAHLDATLDRLADHLGEYLDLHRILAIARSR